MAAFERVRLGRFSIASWQLFLAIWLRRMPVFFLTPKNAAASSV